MSTDCTKQKKQTSPYPHRLLGRILIASFFIILTEQNKKEMDPFQHNLVSRYKPYSTGCVTALGICQTSFLRIENSIGFN